MAGMDILGMAMLATLIGIIWCLTAEKRDG